MTCLNSFHRPSGRCHMVGRLFFLIVKGDEGTEMVYFEKCFKRFDLLLRRLARIMYSISIGAIDAEPPYPLNYPDFQFSEKGYQL